ncbi:hypothetical protein QVD17_26724 [Tagetes erecta]|uniref:Uncharacterized protein n=1 Tax=Tagetes erecta TaxID=13708 RepID=A0AAD8K751_TARER|nr:hypothetical protein QVD17_26724 [Tagetes erecta]
MASTTLIIFTLFSALIISCNLQTTTARRLLFFTIPAIPATLPIPSLPPYPPPAPSGLPSLSFPPLPPFVPTIPSFPFPISAPSIPPFTRIFTPPVAGTIRH